LLVQSDLNIDEENAWKAIKVWISFDVVWY